MKEQEVRERAFAMPLTSPAYPPGPYRFVDREFLVITYRTDPEKLRAVVPEPLQIEAPLVRYEFIRMPDSTGFGTTSTTPGRMRHWARCRRRAAIGHRRGVIRSGLRSLGTTRITRCGGFVRTGRSAGAVKRCSSARR